MMLDELVKLTEIARGQGVAPASAETRLLDDADTGSGRSSGSDVRPE